MGTPGGHGASHGGYEHWHGHNIVHMAGMHGHKRQRKESQKNVKLFYLDILYPFTASSHVHMSMSGDGLVLIVITRPYG